MYIVKRVLMALLTIFVVVTVTFWLMQCVPGGPFTKEKMPNSPETYAALLAKYGLDKPLFVQYLIYIQRAFSFDFGLCMSSKYIGKTVNDVIFGGMRYSFPLGVVAAVLALIIGTLLGSIAAVKRGTWIDRLIMILSTGSVAFPSFVIASFLLYYFALQLGWLPTSSVAAEDFNGGVIMAYILPAITLAIYPAAYITRLARSATLDALGSDYIITARAKGAGKARILFRHVLKNSLAPTITYAGPMFAGIITGSLVIEEIYGVAGVGTPFILAVQV